MFARAVVALVLQVCKLALNSVKVVGLQTRLLNTNDVTKVGSWDQIEEPPKSWGIPNIDRSNCNVLVVAEMLAAPVAWQVML